MVLLIEQKQNPSNPTVFDSTTSVCLEDIYKKCPELFEEAKKFALKPCITFHPKNVLYVRQREDAVTYVGDKLANGEPVQYCGTQDVLTCHVVVLHHPESRGNQRVLKALSPFSIGKYIMILTFHFYSVKPFGTKK